MNKKVTLIFLFGLLGYVLMAIGPSSGGNYSQKQGGTTFGGITTGNPIFGVRNDTNSVITSVDLTYGPVAIDSAGRVKVDATVTAAPEQATGGADTQTDGSTTFKLIAGRDDNSTIRAVRTNSSGNIQVDVRSAALPSNAATLAEQVTGNASLVTMVAQTLEAANTLSTISSKTEVTNNTLSTIAATAATAAEQVLARDLLTQILAENVSIAKSVLQTEGNASLVSILAKLPSFGTAGSPSADILTVQGRQGEYPVSVSVVANPVGNSPGSATVSSAITLVAPPYAVGFVLMNLDTSSANIRWRIGATAAAGSGQQLQPGRDTGFIPCSANVSIVAESGTQNYDINWVLSQ